MIINGVELEDIDIYDLEVAEKYEKALAKVRDLSTKDNSKSLSEGIKFQCNLIFDFFNTVFGEDTDKKIFGNRVNLMTCMKAFEEIVLKMNEQKKEIKKLSDKYSPNRAARRNK
ncbi:AP endonuclease [Clostridium tertium]|jgi:glycyl-tRNA synthetase beta subunit|uniref:AP endonuclease n=1 Tax=Clostridium tertium TaxID=1559 RepID=A0A9X3XST5_9CLOT|nr:DUF6673 family protein [Clostridium tertium]MDC4242507.1 AP endonuclease [Clostridium tertium]